ncbi:thiopeptide-type bacteriocin biosynthesis protein [Actinomadura luteofluorescens]|uniref:thiopeptide-type bacteriocin biosynthesis protein n=1 Tax=Actinomadura luteofluorescens TaxID=46163 RepID=UPI003D94336E
MLEHLLPVLETSQNGEPHGWSFVRKYPTWRLRHHPTIDHGLRRLDRALDMMLSNGLIEGWTPGFYEPENTAFGGAAGMGAAHALFYHDSRLVLQHLGGRDIDEFQ